MSPTASAMTAATPLNCAKAEAELGWAQTVAFEQGLAETVDWYQTHSDLGRTRALGSLPGIGRR